MWVIARTITSAALIMVAVFATFVATGVPSIQQIGLGTAVAIATAGAAPASRSS